MTQEVSKKTVMVLLVLTILVSVVGTWSVLSGLETARPEMIGLNNQANAQVKFSLQQPGIAEPINVLPQTESGQVKLQLV